MNQVRIWISDRTWVWSFVLAFVVWMVINGVSQGRGSATVLSAALQLASFYVLVGIGQMMVIAAGPGNIDLSFPGIMALAAYLSMGAMNGSNSGLLLGLAVGIGIGAVAGVSNVIAIRILRIPPMIATLATGFVLQSMAIAYSGAGSAKPAPMLLDFTSLRLAGIPILALLLFIGVLLVALVFLRTTFGRAVLAIGQSQQAARMAGLKVNLTITSVYLISGVLAGFAATLLAAFSGGASLEIGSDFTLTSIAVVVLGGTAISGGQAAPLGVWGAAILLQLLSTMLNVIGLSDGARFAITGLIILAALTITTKRRFG